MTDAHQNPAGGRPQAGRPQDQEPEEEPTVVRDKRRIDPQTGQVRPPSSSDPTPAATTLSSPTESTGGEAESTGGESQAGGEAQQDLAAQLAERTADLQRLQAEYVNYRRRVERDRESVRELATISALSELLPVLDDIGRAGEHGELTGGFKVVAESLQTSLAKLGLAAFGVQGDPFDPNVHEALMHEYSGQVSEPTCVEVMQSGYRVGERVVRPARVKVAEPEPSDPVGGASAPPGTDGPAAG